MTEKVKTTIKNLEENGYQAEYFQTAKEAKEYLLKEIPIGQSIGFGGSMTLQEDGNSCVASPWGDFAAHMDEKEGILYAQIDLNRVDEVREQLPLLKHRREDVYQIKC